MVEVTGSHWIWHGRSVDYLKGSPLPVIRFRGELLPLVTVLDHLRSRGPRKLWYYNDCGNELCVRLDHNTMCPIDAMAEPEDGLRPYTRLELLGRVMSKTQTTNEGHINWIASISDPVPTEERCLVRGTPVIGAPRPILIYKNNTLHPARLLLHWAELSPRYTCRASKCLNPRHRSAIMLHELEWRYTNDGQQRPYSSRPVGYVDADRHYRPVADLARAI